MPQTKWTHATQNQQTVDEIRALAAVTADDDEKRQIRMQYAGIKKGATKCPTTPAKLVQRMARGVLLAAWPGPSAWINSDIASICRREGGVAGMDTGICAEADSEALDSGEDRTSGLWPELAGTSAGIATTH